jgi:regulatory protein
MKIAKIKKTKYNFYEITILNSDKEEKFKLSEAYLIKYQLYSNKEIHTATYELIKQLANQSQIYHKVLNYLSFKMRTKGEVRNYLLKHNCNETFSTEIMEKLEKLNYLNDKQYCEAYIKQQFDINKKGPNVIKRNLLDKEVDEKIVLECIQTITEAKIINNIIQLISYYEKINKKKSRNQLKESILRNLLVKGYNYDCSINAINEYQFTENNDEFLLEQEMLKAYKRYQKKHLKYELKNRVIKSLIGKGFLYEDILNMYISLNLEG